MKKEDFPKQQWFTPVKGATRDLIRHCGGLDRVALFLGCSESLVGNWNNWDLPDLMPLWAMFALESDLGRPVLSAAYARRTGATVLDPIGPTGRGVKTLAMETAVLMHEVSEFLAAHSDASADGKYTTSELRELRERMVDVGVQSAQSVATIDRHLAERAQ